MSTIVPHEFKNADLSFVIAKATPVVLRTPIDTPVKTSFGIMTDRPAVYLLLEDADGNTGIGEVWCNFPSCGAEHRAKLLNTALLPALIGKPFSDPEQSFYSLQKQFQRLAIQTGEFGPIAQSLAGIDIALWDLVSKRLNVPTHKLFGSKKAHIEVYASGINPAGAVDTLKRCQDNGYNAFKLKIGFGNDVDYPNIENICAELDSNQVLMVDANQAWTLEEAIGHAKRLANYPIQWLEEPMMADAPLDHWNQLKQASAIPLAAGENIADATRFQQANQSDWLSIMQPDLCKWGGFSAVLPIAIEAMANGKRYCPHYLGGGVGLAASAHALAAAGGDGLLEIDSNPNPLREDIYSPRINNGQVGLGDAPGLGIELAQLTNLQSNPTYFISTK